MCHVVQFSHSHHWLVVVLLIHIYCTNYFFHIVSFLRFSYDFISPKHKNRCLLLLNNDLLAIVNVNAALCWLSWQLDAVESEPALEGDIHEKFVCSSVERFNTAGPMT